MSPGKCCVLAFALACTAASAQQNPLAAPTAPTPAQLNGRWKGVNLELRSGCINAQNNGNRGTYAQFDVAADSSGGYTILESGITGLTCTYSGRYQVVGYQMLLQGSYSCSDGKTGSIASGDVTVHPPSLDF